MRMMLFAFLMTGLSGCASWQQGFERRLSFDGRTSQERAEAIEQARIERNARVAIENERIEKINTFKKNLKPGLTMAEIKAVFGDPDRSEFNATQTLHWYDDADEPIFLLYDTKEKLIAKQTDTETISRRESKTERDGDRRQAASERAADRDEMRKDRMMRAFQSMNATRPVSCISNRFGSTVTTNCQ